MISGRPEQLHDRHPRPEAEVDCQVQGMISGADRRMLHRLAPISATALIDFFREIAGTLGSIHGRAARHPTRHEVHPRLAGRPHNAHPLTDEAFEEAMAGLAFRAGWTMYPRRVWRCSFHRFRGRPVTG